MIGVDVFPLLFFGSACLSFHTCSGYDGISTTLEISLLASEKSARRTLGQVCAVLIFFNIPMAVFYVRLLNLFASFCGFEPLAGLDHFFFFFSHSVGRTFSLHTKKKKLDLENGVYIENESRPSFCCHASHSQYVFEFNYNMQRSLSWWKSNIACHVNIVAVGLRGG